MGIVCGSCPDPHPQALHTVANASDLSVTVDTLGSAFKIIEGNFPVSETVSFADTEAAVSGRKGDMIISSHTTESPHGYPGQGNGNVRLSFIETVLITAPGKTGPGRLAFNPNINSSAVIQSCENVIDGGARRLVSDTLSLA